MQPTPGPPASAAGGPPRRPWLFWPALVGALAVVVGGAVVAATGYARTRGPGGAVRGYFEALQRSDAPAALGFGVVPAGPRQLLTSAVLREQQRVAPIVDLRIGLVRRSGAHATVAVSYALRYPGGDSVVDVRIPVHEDAGDWRLDAAVVRTALHLGSASERATVLGRELPSGAVLAFPGAPPIRFDTPYLTLDPDIGFVPASTAVRTFAVTVSAMGRRAMRTAVLAAVRRCLSAASADPTCPLPTERYLPGSVRGTLGAAPTDVSVSLDQTPVGTLELTADVPVRATAYQRLDFHNQVSAGRGPVTLSVRAIAAAQAPLTVHWLTP